MSLRVAGMGLVIAGCATSAAPTALREETAAAGGLFVDLSALMESQARAGMIAADQLHPSAAAYDGWAAELERTLPSPCSPGAGS